jgi:hypothetical protein
MLALARDLDVDPRVRTAARLALAGQKLSLDPLGSEVLWVRAEAGEVSDWLLLSSPPAPLRPAPTAGQRVLPILGVQGSDPRVRLAPSAKPRDDARRDASQAKAP